MGRFNRLLVALLVSMLISNIACGARGKNGNRWDKVPDAFSFVDQTNVTVSTLIRSNAITINGINTATEVSIVGGEYSINNGPFTSITGDVNQGDSVSLRQTSSNQNLTTTDATLIVGGVSDTFSLTTEQAVVLPDTTPDAFSFVDAVDVPPSTLVVSNAIVVSGINNPATISVLGGDYSVNNTAFTSQSGSVDQGDAVVVRQLSSVDELITSDAVLTIGGIADTFSVTTEAVAVTPDTVPEPFNFTDVSDIAPSTLVISNNIVVSGISVPATITVVGGEYSINNNTFSSQAGSVNQGDDVRVRQMSSADNLVTTDTILSIGGVNDTFSVTTEAAIAVDTTPDAFTFVDVNNAVPATAVTSSPVLISGINAPASISISNGLYSINGAAFVAVDGVVNNGDTVAVQVVAANSYSTTVSAAINVSAVSDTFSVTTDAAPAPPTGFVLPPLDAGNPSFTSTHFSGSQNCSFCHNGLSDNAGNDVSIITDWSSSMMANATRDPFWRAKLSSELKRNPALADVINDKCTRCHAPMANEEMRRNNEFINVLGSGLLDGNHARHDEAIEGISCTLCHQIQDTVKLGTLAGFSGKYEINDTKTIYGPYDNLFAQPMVNSTGYTPVFSQHVKDAKLCASCHNLKTPYVDEFGNLLSQTAEDEFPEQMPYSEWLHSDYVNQQSCQDCHMSRADGVAISTRPRFLGQRNNFAIHDFIGANKLMLDIFDTNRERLGVLSNNFAETIAKTDAMLASSATVNLIQSSLSNGTLDFTVRVNSGTGHKLPSSYPSRRVFLHTTVADSAGNIMFESGRVNADGSVVGVDADSDQQAYEPHHDVINSEDQVQVYEAVMGNNLNQVTYTLLRGMQYLKDNRLLPDGFDKSTAPADIAVMGAAMADANFVGGSDDVRYQVSGLIGGNYTVTVELVYQTIAYAFAQDLFNENTDEVNDFRIMYSNSPYKSSVIASGTFSVN